jgi:hypothetical protein
MILGLCNVIFKHKLKLKVALNLWRSTANILSWLYKLSLTDVPYVITSTEKEDGLNTGIADKICATTFKNEIAHLTLEIADPRVLEVVLDVRVTFPDMLGNVGKIMFDHHRN